MPRILKFRYYTDNRPAWTDLARQRREARSLDEAFDLPFRGDDVLDAHDVTHMANPNFRRRAWQNAMATAVTNIEALAPGADWALLHPTTIRIRGFETSSGPLHNMAKPHVAPYMAGALLSRFAGWADEGYLWEDLFLDNFDPRVRALEIMTSQPNEDTSTWDTGLQTLAFYAGEIAPGVCVNIPYRSPNKEGTRDSGVVIQGLAVMRTAICLFEHFPGTTNGAELEVRMKYLSDLGMPFRAVADISTAQMATEARVSAVWAAVVIAAEDFGPDRLSGLSLEPPVTEGGGREKLVAATLAYNEGFGAKYAEKAQALGTLTKRAWSTRSNRKIVAEYEHGRVTLDLAKTLPTAKWEA